jgi:aminoglycoside phosphotransferase (APT) family kinase protein
VAERIHDDELDTSEGVVRALLEAQCPELAGAPLTYLQAPGTTNAMWRVRRADGDDLVVRLPRLLRSAAKVPSEVGVLEAVASSWSMPSVRTPTVCHVGAPDEAYPHPWLVLGWLDGTDAWTARASIDHDDLDLAAEVATLVHTIAGLDGVPARSRRDGERGGPIGPLLESLDWWLSDPQWDAGSFVDVAAIRRLADEARELEDLPVAPGFVHGDLIPGNLLVRDGRLAAAIDWGSCAIADPAQDLTPAWALFDRRARQAFREAVGCDDAAWLRARTFELEQTVGGIVYYRPKGHPLGDVMARTLARILDEVSSPSV